MQDIQIIKDNFDFTEAQFAQLKQYAEIIVDWNDKINMVSRKDIDNFVSHHILHALSICKKYSFKANTKILDLGTGGGLPGIPLSIVFPEVKFNLIDARAKKIMVVKEAIESLGLKNVQAAHIRVEDVNQKYDFVVSRAVAKLDKLLEWSRRLILEKNSNAVPNGLIALKGGEYKSIQAELPKFEYLELDSIEEIYTLDYYKDKYIVYVQA